VQFTAERYLTEVVSLDVEGGHVRQELTAGLTPSWAPVTLSSVPSGADILVDGRVLGSTPDVLELTAGDREIEIALPGYNSWQRQVRVIADEPLELPAVSLSLADGRIALATEPSDAQVMVNGEYVGTSPQNLNLPPNVEHRLTVSKPGYETRTVEMTFEPGARESLDIELVPRIGLVEVTSDPPGAEVVIGNETVGVTPYLAELMAVAQSITIRLDGFADEEQTITPRPGYPQGLAFDLTPLDETTGGGYPRVVTTDFGTRLRIVPAGRFLMGSSRSDPDRRRNEILREVEISRAFYLAETEMTNADYRRCDPDHDSGTFDGHPLNGDDQPVVNVTVQEVFACLNRLSIEAGLQPVYEEINGVLAPRRPLRNGYRLATEAEFVWAMRAARRDDAVPLRFSWGQALPPPDRYDNLADLTASDILALTLVTYTDGHAVSAPVGSFTANAVGLFDMGGNVAEWVQDFYDPNEAPADEVLVDPLGPETGRLNVVRGPSWMSATETRLRLSYRDYEDLGRVDLGFRIARNLE
jgi:formylglycine-generating enzyme required for sulfatase activity